MDTVHVHAHARAHAEHTARRFSGALLLGLPTGSNAPTLCGQSHGERNAYCPLAHPSSQLSGAERHGPFHSNRLSHGRPYSDGPSPRRASQFHTTSWDYLQDHAQANQLTVLLRNRRLRLDRAVSIPGSIQIWQIAVLSDCHMANVTWGPIAGPLPRSIYTRTESLVHLYARPIPKRTPQPATI